MTDEQWEHRVEEQGITNRRSTYLQDAVVRWPTPRDSDANTASQSRLLRAESGDMDWGKCQLREAVKPNTNWPTPATRDYKGAVAPETLEAKGRNATNSLGDAIHEGASQGSLNPDWVNWLMGLKIGWCDIECDEPMEHPGWDDDPAEFFPTKAASERGPHTGREVVGDRQVRAHKSGQTAGMTLETYVVHNPVGKENIPRLTTRKDNRANRLKACGNGVVPHRWH